MTVGEFLSKIQASYNQYRPGMYKEIEHRLSLVDEEKLTALFNLIVSNWGKQHAPLFYDIKTIAEGARIYLSQSTGQNIRICEFCYYGIGYIKNAAGKLVLEQAIENKNEDRGKKRIFPRKVVRIGNEGNNACPVCNQKSARGLWIPLHALQKKDEEF